MFQSLRPGPWDDAVVAPAASSVSRDDQTPLLTADIRPNRAGLRVPVLALTIAAFVALALSGPRLVHGEPIMAVLFLIELSALSLATYACRRSAQDRRQEIIVFPDEVEVRTTIRGRTSVERLPTAWLTLRSPPNGRGLILDTRRRPILVATWLGPGQRNDLHQTLDDVLALTRRGGLATSQAPTRLWCSRALALAHAPIDPALWAGGAGQS